MSKTEGDKQSSFLRSSRLDGEECDSRGSQADPVWHGTDWPRTQPPLHKDVKRPWRKPGRFCTGSHISERDGGELGPAGRLVKTGPLIVSDVGLGWTWSYERGGGTETYCKLTGPSLNITSGKYDLNTLGGKHIFPALLPPSCST